MENVRRTFWIGVEAMSPKEQRVLEIVNDILKEKQGMTIDQVETSIFLSGLLDSLDSFRLLILLEEEFGLDASGKISEIAEIDDVAKIARLLP